MAVEATSTLLRLLHLLQALSASSPESASNLRRKLEHQGHKVSQRMVERDLCKLEAVGLANARDGKPQGWLRGQAALGLQLLDLNQALALDMLDTYAGHLLPPSVAVQLRDLVATARKRLDIQQNSDLARWRERVATIPLSQPLIPPPVDSDVQRLVLEAVLERRVLKVQYRARYADRHREREVHAAGLVARDGQYILIGFLPGKTDPTQLVLHRMRSAELLTLPAQVPASFRLREYASTAAMGMGNGEWVRLNLLFDETAGYLFTESRLSPDQEVETAVLKNGKVRYRVTATLEDSPRLQAYLNSFGDSLISRRQSKVPKPADQGLPSIPSTRR